MLTMKKLRILLRRQLVGLQPARLRKAAVKLDLRLAAGCFLCVCVRVCVQMEKREEKENRNANYSRPIHRRLFVATAAERRWTIKVASPQPPNKAIATRRSFESIVISGQEDDGKEKYQHFYDRVWHGAYLKLTAPRSSTLNVIAIFDKLLLARYFIHERHKVVGVRAHKISCHVPQLLYWLDHTRGWTFRINLMQNSCVHADYFVKKSGKNKD